MSSYLSVYNTLSRKKENFVPIRDDCVSMYVCGPTVYDIPHIGNARCMVIYDVLYRILRLIYGKNNVTYVRNITDIDDKIINRAKELQIKISSLTNNITASFHEDMQYLGCLKPNYEPKATENIKVMIGIITTLIQNNHAYVSNDGHVYFSVKTFTDYNVLSNRTFEDMLSNTRIEPDLQKRYLADFILWKPCHENEIGASFNSPWGKGRPGWHIECSAMSYKFLGTNFDIHGGGADLIFPHHTNEIAQSRCAFPNSNYARYWIHNGFLTAHGKKMSKSMGNFITVQDLRKRNINGEIIRLMFVNTHYRSPLDFNDKALDNSAKIINSLYDAIIETSKEIEQSEFLSIDDVSKSKYVNEFKQILFDDLNTPKAISYLCMIAKKIKQSADLQDKITLSKTLIYTGNIIGILAVQPHFWYKEQNIKISEENIKLLVEQRIIAKRSKKWQTADRIRNELLTQGIMLTDKADGSTSWQYANNKNIL